ncbi:hypothetical protein CVT25_010094 [Psilocybe cyanescens]|uniref:Uncharacterized protein n=1 Tax=Psilocybe cyanescens TaxID=93625 RepID=A0A409XGS5_PSICY|nr:hypothetical protein CVT25_010094 [Psilocybe cyanescens]
MQRSSLPTTSSTTPPSRSSSARALILILGSAHSLVASLAFPLIVEVAAHLTAL